MNNSFSIELCSDLDYEEMVVDVSYNNTRIAMVTQENGINHMEIEIFNYEQKSLIKFPLDEFITTLVRAKKCLIKMQNYLTKSG